MKKPSKLGKMAGILIVFTGLFVGSYADADETIETTIGLIGDSTVESSGGWGPPFASRTKDSVAVLNFAKSGGTLKWLSKDLDELLKKEPDYVLIQFGHNDMKFHDAKAYQRLLTGYIERIVKAGSKPIVLSSVTRRSFDEQGKIEPRVVRGRTLPDFAVAAREVAEKNKVPFIDLNTISIEHHNKIGPEESATYNPNEDDSTHFNEKGAEAIANLIIPELKKAVPELAECFK